MDILGVRIDNLTKKEILERIEFFLNEKRFHQIATVNPELILKAQNDEVFKNILNASDLNVADGVGIWYAFIKNLKFLKSRITGADLMHDILRIANEKKMNVFLAVSKKGLSSLDEIRSILAGKYPELKITGWEYDFGNQLSVINHQDDQLQMTNDCILLCNFGAPDQEVFINSVKNDSIRLAMGVGGSFDFVTGKVKRAPKMMRILGLEWLWRFVQEPRYRFKRILNAVIVFPIKIIFSK